MTIPTQPAILYDRSRVTTFWRCPRSRYWAYEHDGKGVTSNTLALELFTGTIIHDGLAAIAANVPIDKIADAAREQMYEGITVAAETADTETFAREQAALTEGLLRGFHRYVWPRLIHEYPKVVAIEQEVIYNHDNVSMMAKPDLLMEDREGNLWYVEYKSTSSNKEQWINSWSTAVQLHSSIRAVEQTLDRKVTGIIVQGLYKGYVSYGKQTSPFCYGYFRPGNPPFSTDTWRYTYEKGFNKYPIWERAGGVKAWVENMPEDMLRDQFPQVPPIFINDRLIDAFFRQRTESELEIRMAREALRNDENTPDVKQQVLDMTFPQRFDQCAPSFGKPCQFRKLCFSGIDDPLAAGYVYREPHHTPEQEQWAANGAATEATI